MHSPLEKATGAAEKYALPFIYW